MTSIAILILLAGLERIPSTISAPALAAELPLVIDILLKPEYEDSDYVAIHATNAHFHIGFYRSHFLKISGTGRWTAASDYGERPSPAGQGSSYINVIFFIVRRYGGPS